MPGLWEITRQRSSCGPFWLNIQQTSAERSRRCDRHWRAQTTSGFRKLRSRSWDLRPLLVQCGSTTLCQTLWRRSTWTLQKCQLQTRQQRQLKRLKSWRGNLSKLDSPRRIRPRRRTVHPRRARLAAPCCSSRFAARKQPQATGPFAVTAEGAGAA
eukprot:s2931_g1.t1